MASAAAMRVVDAAPQASGDAAQLIALLAWCRANGVVTDQASVGSASVSIAGERFMPSERETAADAVTKLGAKTDEQARTELYQEFGGDAFRHLTAAASDADEDYPVIGGDGG